MYAFIIESLWNDYLKKNPNKNANNIADNMEFLQVVGTPYLFENTHNIYNIKSYKGVVGHCVQISNGSNVKYRPYLINTDTELSGQVYGMFI